MISKEEIIRKIGSLLEDLTVKFDHVSNAENDVHPLEFQLLEVQASYFAEHTSILRKLEEETINRGKEVLETATSDIKETVSEPIVFTPPISDEIAKEEKLDSQETQEEIPEQEETPMPSPADLKPREEKASSSANDINPSENDVDSAVKDADAGEIKEAKQSGEDANSVSSPDEVINKVVIEEKKVSLVNDKPMSLNDRLSESRKSMAESSTSQREAPSRIRDIKSVISLNDKLMFIKDLFNGYSLAYSEAIELLNRFETFEDAQRFLQTNYAEKNSWQTKQASVDKLNAILRKRYNS